MVSRNPEGRLTFAGSPVDRWLSEAATTTPAYLYDIDAIRAAARNLRAAFSDVSHLVAYAVKANSAGAIVGALADEGCGADVVSGAELRLALALGLLPDDIIFSGVAKLDDEIDLALSSGTQGIAAIQVESVEEIARIAARSRALGQRARISIRINPGIALDTHAHVATGHDEAKFGIAMGDLGDAWDAIASHSTLDLVGLSAHIGSTQTETGPYLDAARLLFDIARDRISAGTALSFVDAGGGFGIDYGNGCPVRPADFVRGLLALRTELRLESLRLVVEPGRSLVAPFGILVSSVVQIKHARSSGRRWLMIDAGMNDLVRPALYGARHRIEADFEPPRSTSLRYRVVGPICESADDFGWHDLPEIPPKLVAVRDAGAYGFVMASQYNGRALPAEVFIARGKVVGATRRASADSWIDDRLASRAR